MFIPSYVLGPGTPMNTKGWIFPLFIHLFSSPFKNSLPVDIPEFKAPPPPKSPFVPQTVIGCQKPKKNQNPQIEDPIHQLIDSWVGNSWYVVCQP